MTKPVIAVDMDDTICHFIRRAIFHNNNDFPTHPLRYEDMIDWNTDHLRHPDSTHDVFFNRPRIYEELELFDEHVVAEMEKLNESYDLIIVTAGDPSSAAEKWNWLQKHMPFISLQQLFVCKRKSLIEYDLLIDDGMHNLLPAIERGKKVLCIPHPWNLKALEQYKVPVMESWEGAKERIDAIFNMEQS